MAGNILADRSYNSHLPKSKLRESNCATGALLLAKFMARERAESRVLGQDALH